MTTLLHDHEPEPEPAAAVPASECAYCLDGGVDNGELISSCDEDDGASAAAAGGGGERKELWDSLIDVLGSPPAQPEQQQQQQQDWALASDPPGVNVPSMLVDADALLVSGDASSAFSVLDPAGLSLSVPPPPKGKGKKRQRQTRAPCGGNGDTSDSSHQEVPREDSNDSAASGSLKSTIHICNECNRPYTTKEGLRLHVRNIHSKDKKYECGHCPATFVRKADLNLHLVRVHVPPVDRPCPCDFEGCTKAFACKSELARHKKTHLSRPRTGS